MTRRRLVFVIVTLLWLPLAWGIWERVALLEPYASIAIADDQRVHWFSPSGHIIVKSVRLSDESDGKKKSYASYGPISFHSVQDGSKLFERFLPTDRVFSMEVTPETVTAIERDGKKWLVDLESGKLLNPLPDDIPKQYLTRAGNHRVVFADDAGFRCSDYDSGQDVWRFPTGRAKMFQAETPTHAIVYAEIAETGKSQMRALRLEDGRVEERIGPARSYAIEEHSPDGRYLVIRKRQSAESNAEILDYEVFDTVLQKSIPLMNGVSGHAHVELAFSLDSSEIRAFTLIGDRLKMGQMRLADSEMLAKGPFALLSSGARLTESITVSKDHRWALVTRSAIDDSIWRSIQQFIGRVCKFFGRKYTLARAPVEMALYELPGGRRLGVVARDWPAAEISRLTNFSTWPSPRSDCFLIERRDEKVAELYSPNASRRWQTLVKLAAGPPLVVAALGWLIGRRRKSRSAGGPVVVGIPA